MKNHALTKDQLAALDEVSRMAKNAKPSACVARNAKHLIGIKLLKHRKDGGFALTDSGAEAVFIRRCIAGLRAMADNPDTALNADVTAFLGRKGHIAATDTPGKFEITAKGRECLADIAQNP
ncbi:MAG: hypothetical protein JNN20_16525 [Betaproteobacteria bacterium]|nr:hypothetical protein [Betaproteobacteria bacterium]